MQQNVKEVTINKNAYKLIFGVIELTTACNLRCIHCGTNAGCSRKKELNTEEMKNLIDQFADLETISMAFSGGEPLVRKDWLELALHVKKQKMELSILTNGILVNQETIFCLEKVEPIAVSVSIDGIGKTHDIFRGMSGAFDKSINALKLMRNHLPHCVVTTITKHNIEELPKLLKLMLSLDVWTWQIQIGLPIGRLTEKYALDITEIKRVAEFISESRNKINQIEIVTADCIGYYVPGLNLRDNPWKGCMAGRILTSVTSDGNVVGCLSMPNRAYEGNIRNRPLKEIWEDKNNYSYNRKWNPKMLTGKCKDCEKQESCRSGCNSVKFALNALNEYPICLR